MDRVVGFGSMDNGGGGTPSSMASSAPNWNSGDAAFDPAGLRVLVVDDDPTCLKILEMMLRKCLYEGIPLLDQSLIRVFYFKKQFLGSY